MDVTLNVLILSILSLSILGSSGVLVVAYESVSFLPFLAFPALHVH